MYLGLHLLTYLLTFMPFPGSLARGTRRTSPACKLKQQCLPHSTCQLTTMVLLSFRPCSLFALEHRSAADVQIKKDRKPEEIK
ncbi:hypothetical protein BDV35DRAFT_337954 [Aspergillus flavus]|uniref:Secreted protein n=1 Tax=Aspergillus flavus TaxID=5059 RepID=A0A5N6HH96_ASPFL|nr:hypothetical protein BDV35DRAFT_337954 [Aspergillus flavus]